MTRPYAEVIGDPIAHSKSPLIHNFWLAKLGIDAEYRTCHVRASELQDYFTRRRGDAEWRGCNVTIPHKEAAVRHLDMVSREASRLGAVNTVCCDDEGQLIGDNTDITGIDEALRNVFLQGATASIVGGGGAASAAIYALSRAGVAKFNLLVRSEQRGRELLDRHGAKGECLTFEQPPRGRLLVNATPLGMIGQRPLDVTVAEMDKDATVFDMVYSPPTTDLLKQARARGLGTRDGLLMLVGQARSAFHKFFEANVPPEYDAELRALLTA